jgi:hypothetical protein
MVKARKRRQRRARSVISASRLPKRSQAARHRARGVIAALRRNPKLSFSRAAKLKKVKPSTVRKYYSSDLRRTKGRLRATKSDRRTETVYLPDSQGQIVPRETHSSAERSQASDFLRDLGRYQRDKPNNLADWKDRTIGGIDLLTDRATIRAAEPVLSDFSLYRGIGGN